MSAVAGLIVLVIGLVSLVSPDTAYHLREGWKHKNTAPSDSYLLWARVSGGAMVLAGLYLIFFGN